MTEDKFAEAFQNAITAHRREAIRPYRKALFWLGVGYAVLVALSIVQLIVMVTL